jgi:adenine-specific DNA-methyltransferase
MQEWAEYEFRLLEDYDVRKAVCGNNAVNIPKNISAIVLVRPHGEVESEARQRYENGFWPLLYFTGNGNGGIRCKRYLEETGGRIVTNLWNYEEVGHTDEASKEIKAIFDGAALFDTPKPTRLIERILHIATAPGDIILDSFAGSGTTAHAVLNMNKADGGNRRFILVEMEDYAETITAERVRRVIDGYGETAGTGGSFDFCELGEPLLFADGNLNEAVGLEKIREYVWYTETHAAYTPQAEPHFLGKHAGAAYYFYYEKDEPTTLDLDFLCLVTAEAEQYVIYADVCALSATDLKRAGITFKKIPRDIKRF